MTKYRDLIPVIVEREQATMPDWADSWGVKSVHPDLTTYGDCRWPYPGGTAKCDPAQILNSNTDACPRRPGDGLCVATNWAGMASGCIPARTLLLIAFSSGEVLGRDSYAGKLRLPRVYVAALVDGERLLREAGHGANLARANLYRANLYGSNLALANLARSNLAFADLRGSKLTGADLTGSDLTGSDLTGSDLTGARMPAEWSQR